VEMERKKKLINGITSHATSVLSTDVIKKLDINF
jgi:hypothetical protein